jgi:hypothetical protein
MNEMEGLRLEAGEEAHCYEEGSMGADRPRLVLPDGTILRPSNRLVAKLSWRVALGLSAGLAWNPHPNFCCNPEEQAVYG